MEVICLEDEAFYKLVETVVKRIKQTECTGNDPNGCFNAHIYIKVTYFCNDCGSQG